MHYIFHKKELQYMMKLLKINSLYGVPQKKVFFKKPQLNNKITIENGVQNVRSDLHQLLYYWQNIRYSVCVRTKKKEFKYIMFNMGYIISLTIKRNIYELNFERYTDVGIYNKLIELLNIDVVTPCKHEFKIPLSHDDIEDFMLNKRTTIDKISKEHNIEADVLESFKNTIKRCYQIKCICRDHEKEQNMTIVKVTGSYGIYLIKHYMDKTWLLNANSSTAVRELYIYS